MSGSPQAKQKVQSLFVLLLVSSMLLPGCASSSRYGTQTTNAFYYSDCYAPLKELRSNEFAVEKGVAVGALAGAAFGAILGYAITGKGSGAAAGAAIGGVTGGAAGGVYASRSQDADDAARLAQYNSQLDGNIREVDKATAAAKVARQCYERRFADSAREYKAGRLTREQFDSRYREVASGLEEAANIMGTATQNSSQVAGEYERALEQEAQKQKVSVAAVRKSSPSAPVSSTAEGRQLSTLAKRSNDMQRSISAAEEEERLLRERLSATHKQAQDLMS